MAAIYGLIDPRTGDLRYIGKAKKRAIHRYLQRMGHAFKGATHWDEARRARNAEALQRVKMLARSDPDSLYAMLVEKGHA